MIVKINNIYYNFYVIVISIKEYFFAIQNTSRPKWQ